LLKFGREPKFMKQFKVAGFQVAEGLGRIGMLVIDLHPLKSRPENELAMHADLQQSIGEEIDCRIEDWKFVGTVESAETRAQGSLFRLTVRDALSKLDQTFASQVFAERTVEDILAALLPPKQDFECTGGCGSAQIKLAIQYQESNLTFLRRVAQRVGGQVWCSGGKVYLGTGPTSDSFKLLLGRDLSDFSIQTRVGPESVAVDSVPYVDKNNVQRSTIELAGAKYGDVQDAAVDLRKKLGEKAEFHIVHEDSSFDDTGQFGRQFLRSRSFGRLTVTGTVARPLPIGAKLTLENFDRSSGQTKGRENTMVKTITGYGDSATGESNWQLEAANPESVLDEDDRVPDKVVTSTAIVDDADDPNKSNRVSVYFPWDRNETSIRWLRVTTPSWGDSHAFFMPPKIGDTVLVTWGRMDMDPVVLGCVSAGDDLDLYKEAIVLKTVDGHTITVGGNTIRINNESSGGKTDIKVLPDQVVVTTKNNQKVTIGSDSLKLVNGGSSIEIQSAKVVIKSAEVEISSSAGASVKLSGPQVSVNNGALEVI